MDKIALSPIKGKMNILRKEGKIKSQGQKCDREVGRRRNRQSEGNSKVQ